MPAIARVDVIAAGPPTTTMQFTDALPAVHTTVTYVLLTDEAGTVGFGAVESDTFGDFDLAPLEALRTVAPALIGQDPLRPSAVAALASSRVSSASRLVPCAAVEVACWDLMGRRAGLPLYQLLGGARDEVAAYASLPFESDLQVLQGLVDEVRAAGYPAVKLHVSGDPRRDAAQVAGVATAFPDIQLIVDAESVYDRHGAAIVGRALEGLNVGWFEAPLPDRDVAGYSELTRMLQTPVVPAGGLIDDPREVAEALRSNPWAAVRTQTMEGGIEHVRDLAALARAHGIDLQLCSYGTTVTQAVDLQVILGLGVGHYYEQAYPVEPWEFGTTVPIRVQNGRVRAPEGPGLGVELDLDAIDAATVARFSTPA